MAEFNALPIFTDALLADTTHLGDAEFGSYMALLIVAWRRPTCTLPDDDAFLARIARCSLRVWRSSRRAAMAPFFNVEDGEWRQGKLLEVRCRVAEKVAKRKAAAEARWSGSKDLADAHALQMQGHGDATKTKTKSVSDDTDIIPPMAPPLPKPMPKETLSKARHAGREAHGTRLPPEWRPDDRGLAFAHEVGMAESEVVEEEVEKFREHWMQKSGRDGRKADWGMAWRTWCRNWRDWGRHRPRPAPARGRPAASAGHGSRFERADGMVEAFINDAIGFGALDDGREGDASGAPAGHLRLAYASSRVR